MGPQVQAAALQKRDGEWVEIGETVEHEVPEL